MITGWQPLRDLRAQFFALFALKALRREDRKKIREGRKVASRSVTFVSSILSNLMTKREQSHTLVKSL